MTGSAEGLAAEEVLRAARKRAAALAAGDAAVLRRLLHPEFRWTSHTGEHFDREGYVAANTGGRTTWRGQTLVDPQVSLVASTAVLRALAVDAIMGPNGPETFRMPMTQVWVRSSDGWQCLAGHAGPRMRE